MKFSMTRQEKGYRWLLNGGDRMGRIDCIYRFKYF